VRLLLWACDRPRISALELDRIYPLAFVISCVAAHLRPAPLAGEGRAAGAAAIAAAVVAMVAAVWIHPGRCLVLQVWGDSRRSHGGQGVFGPGHPRSLDLGRSRRRPAGRAAPTSSDHSRHDAPIARRRMAGRRRCRRSGRWRTRDRVRLDAAIQRDPGIDAGDDDGAIGRLRGRVVGWALKLDPRHILLAERLAAG
jgi:hypothetical protein